MDLKERRALLLLTLTSGLGPVLTRRAMQQLGSACAVAEAKAAELAEVPGIGRQTAEELRRRMDQILESGRLEREEQLMQEHGVHLVGLEEAEYPALLRHIPDPPVALYVRGQILASDALALAVVGSRRCTAYGREQADRLAASAAQCGLCIISGGAYGIDITAHRAALRVGGRTIAVLGSGLARPYPAEHKEIFDRIAAGQGALVSELPMDTAPAAENFPRRNRIISGLALGVLVVEAAATSGALITARIAAEEHGREVMAVPGRVDSPASAGCHKMIREGWASLVRNLADVLEELGEAGSTLRASLGEGAPEAVGEEGSGAGILETNLSASQRKILQVLKEPAGLDQIAAATGLAVPTIQADLTVLQIRGLVERGAGFFRRKKRSGA